MNKSNAGLLCKNTKYPSLCGLLLRKYIECYIINMSKSVERRNVNWKKNKLINDFTAGSIPKKMLLFAVPFMVSNLMQVLYSLVDMIVVGQFVGSYGLSAVSVASQIFTFMTMVCLGFSNGGHPADRRWKA